MRKTDRRQKKAHSEQRWKTESGYTKSKEQRLKTGQVSKNRGIDEISKNKYQGPNTKDQRPKTKVERKTDQIPKTERQKTESQRSKRREKRPKD